MKLVKKYKGINFGDFNYNPEVFSIYNLGLKKDNNILDLFLNENSASVFESSIACERLKSLSLENEEIVDCAEYQGQGRGAPFGMVLILRINNNFYLLNVFPAGYPSMEIVERVISTFKFTN